MNRIRVNKKFLQQLLVDFENGLIDKTVRSLIVEEPAIEDEEDMPMAAKGGGFRSRGSGGGVGGRRARGRH